MTTLYEHRVETLQGAPTTLEPYRGKVLLIVNTASACGFTPQLAGLQALYEQLGERGLVVLGFPCNQFGAQEPGTNAEIGQFCAVNFGVTFPMFAKIDVNGANTHPLWADLKRGAPGLLGSEAIKWNFTKFLVGRDGKVLARFAPKDAPSALRGAIERALGDAQV